MKTINVKGVSNTLSDKEMKLVKGGLENFAEDTAGDVTIDAGDYARCKKKECSKNSECSSGSCVRWSDCPDPDQRRCL